MKKFDLERALAGDPVTTRNGQPVTEIHYFKSCSGAYPVAAVVNGALLTFRKNGWIDATGTQPDDLFMAPVKKEEWVNIYKRGSRYEFGGKVYPTKEDAEHYHKEVRDVLYVTTVKIREWEE